MNKITILNNREITYNIDENNCWIVTSHPQRPDGYFSLHVTENGKRKHSRIHREVYKYFNGEIPYKKHVRHTCDNRACINPEHLIVGTNKQNVQDRVDRGRCAKGSKQGQSKLTEENVLTIFNSDKSNSILAKEFNVNSATIRRIKIGENWAHVTMNQKNNYER